MDVLVALIQSSTHCGYDWVRERNAPILVLGAQGWFLSACSSSSLFIPPLSLSRLHAVAGRELLCHTPSLLTQVLPVLPISAVNTCTRFLCECVALISFG